jgi:hypothetical protein
MFPVGAELMSLLETVLGGAVAGAASAWAIIKVFMQHHLEKSQRKLQQEIDQEKEERRSQLEVMSATQKVRPISFEQKNIIALEVAYGAVVKTSFARHKFRKNPTTTKFSGTPDEKKTGQYFHMFSENFRAFSNAFDALQRAFRDLEDHAIYLDPELEHRVIIALANIDSFYQRRHSQLKSAHEKANSQFDGKVIPQELRSFDFESFHRSMLEEWKQQTTPIREELKALVRSQLRLGQE